MMRIEAIETIYKGYRFRSRLEARWAIFFDMMGYDWEYEPEGFILEDGTYYLPDFRVHTKTYNDTEFWVEVKPKKLNEEEKKKCELLAKGTGVAVVLAIGVPDNIFYDEISSGDNEQLYRMGIMFEHHKYGTYMTGEEFGKPAYWECETRELAVDMARSARFEYGESKHLEKDVECFKVKGDFRNKSQVKGECE